MAKQAQIFEKAVTLPPEAIEDRALLVALGDLSSKNAHHNMDPSAISEVRFKATFDRSDRLESLRIELVGSRLPYIELRGESLSALHAHSSLERGILRLMGKAPELDAHARPDALTASNAEIAIDPHLRLSPAVQRRCHQLRFEKDQLESQFLDSSTYDDAELVERLTRRHGAIRKVLNTYDSFIAEFANYSRADKQLN